MDRKYIIGIIIIIVFIIWAAFSIKKTFTPYVSISEAKNANSIVQIKGTVIEKDKMIETEQGIRFLMSDEKQDIVEVIYHGAKPANFGHAQGVVCIGKYENNHFNAQKLLVKCPSKYTSREESEKRTASETFKNN
jgi:cytochrome c-type biogenesis protein CcmE